MLLELLEYFHPMLIAVLTFAVLTGTGGVPEPCSQEIYRA